MIGRKFVLHSVPFPGNPSEKSEDTFVLVSVKELKDVPCIWEQGKFRSGFRAESEDGRNFYNNWDVYDDASSSPLWFWSDERGNAWYDICQGIFDNIPFRPSFMDKYDEILHYCSSHQRLDYKETHSAAKNDFAKSQGHSKTPYCFHCLLNKPAITVEIKGWKGWR